MPHDPPERNTPPAAPPSDVPTPGVSEPFFWNQYLLDSLGPGVSEDRRWQALLDLYVICWQVLRLGGLLARPASDFGFPSRERFNTPWLNVLPDFKQRFFEGLTRLPTHASRFRPVLSETLLELTCEVYCRAFCARIVPLATVQDPSRDLRALIYRNVEHGILDLRRRRSSSSYLLFKAVERGCHGALQGARLVTRRPAANPRDVMHAILELADRTEADPRCTRSLSHYELISRLRERPECVQVVRSACRPTSKSQQEVAALLELILRVIPRDCAFKPLHVFKALCEIALSEGIFATSEVSVVSLHETDRDHEVLDIQAWETFAMRQEGCDLRKALGEMQSRHTGGPTEHIFRAMSALLDEDSLDEGESDGCSAERDHGMGGDRIFARAQKFGYPFARARFFEDLKKAREELRKYLDGTSS